uniref:Uncharacterized protein n=1 Tax=Myripristis murdjan TaxID=586833 RepID=A0A667ZXY7_9TELE
NSTLRHSDSVASGLTSVLSRVKQLSSGPNRTGNDKSPESGAYRNSLFYGSTVEKFLKSAQIVSPTLVSFQYTGNSIAHVVQRCTPAVVQIETFTMKGFTKIIPVGSGSGFIISSNRIIVTAAHVLKKIFHVRLASGEVCRGTVLHIDEEADIAIIRIKAKHPLPFLPLKGLSEVLQGHVVLAMGSPFVLQNWMAFGIVSAVRRSCAAHQMEMNEMSYVQHHVTLEYGYSGGPLLNLEGEVIGMHVSQGGEGIAISVKLELLETDIQCMQSAGKNYCTTPMRKGLDVRDPAQQSVTMDSSHHSTKSLPPSQCLPVGEH